MPSQATNDGKGDFCGLAARVRIPGDPGRWLAIAGLPCVCRASEARQGEATSGGGASIAVAQAGHSAFGFDSAPEQRDGSICTGTCTVQVASTGADPREPDLAGDCAILRVAGNHVAETGTVETLALAIEVEGDGRALGLIAEAVAAAEARITWISILDAQKAVETILVEVAGAGNQEALMESLRALQCVSEVSERPTLHHIFGKRIVVIGGGSQVGQVVLGAVSEADRHNLRGERISVDTMPLVGESKIAEAVRATARLPRVEGVVLAGALMGGEIESAVRDVRAKGLLVVSLNMAGSVPDAADLVVTDPVQAGVMAVMAVAHTARFDIRRLGSRRF